MERRASTGGQKVHLKDDWRENLSSTSAALMRTAARPRGNHRKHQSKQRRSDWSRSFSRCSVRSDVETLFWWLLEWVLEVHAGQIARQELMVLFAQTDFQNIAQKHARVCVKMPRFRLLKQMHGTWTISRIDRGGGWWKSRLVWTEEMMLTSSLHFPAGRHLVRAVIGTSGRIRTRQNPPRQERGGVCNSNHMAIKSGCNRHCLNSSSSSFFTKLC